MAILYISEYLMTGTDYKGLQVMAGKEPAIATQAIAIGGASVPSAAFTSGTRFVRLHTDANCNILFSSGATPTAIANTSPRMAANQTEFFGVVPGGIVAVIAGA